MSESEAGGTQKHLRNTWQNGIAPDFMIQLLSILPNYIELVIVLFPLPFATGLLKGILEFNRMFGKVMPSEVQCLIKMPNKPMPNPDEDTKVLYVGNRHNFALSIDVVKNDMIEFAKKAVTDTRPSATGKKNALRPNKATADSDNQAELKAEGPDDVSDSEGGDVGPGTSSNDKGGNFIGCIEVDDLLDRTDLAENSQADSDEESPEYHSESKVRSVTWSLKHVNSLKI